ncbi:hypothetical protein EV182_003757 [Spiromyces aspiralis]|uniref:Uncharacterized protein n=1 Tax=Spiromyces aspiralis TaxID=68401 RepID=A0ACC1HPW4_9FUNG|nr:hypothetical protein EV182_003757 [Spiromyces aspiralis]
MPTRPFFNVLVTDFDKTLTTTDTISAVGHVLDTIHSTDARYHNVPPFHSFVEKYMADTKAHDAWFEEIFRDYAKQGKTCSSHWLMKYLEGMTWVERESISRAVAHGFFKGATKQQMYKTGARSPLVQLQPNAALALASIWDRCRTGINPITVLSVNWSADLIRGCIEQGVDDFLSATGCPDIVNRHKVESLARQVCVINPDMEFGPRSGLSTGKLTRTLHAGIDKLRYFDTIIEDYKAAAAPGRCDLRFAYAGDSINDLFCLRKCFA